MSPADHVERADRGPWAKRTEHDRTDSLTRSQLLQAADRVFSEHGYAGASIARIASAAGVSRATFYVYFTSREEVFHVLAEEVVAESEQAQRVPGADFGDPRAIIAASIRTILGLYTRRARLITMIEQQSKHDPRVAELWQVFWEGQSLRAQRFVSRLEDRGLAAPVVDAVFASENMTAVLLHYALSNPDLAEDDFQRLADRLATVYERLIGLGLSPTP